MKGLIGRTVFGTGWKTFERKYPVIRVLDDYIIIFDASEKWNFEENKNVNDWRIKFIFAIFFSTKEYKRSENWLLFSNAKSS